MSVAEVFVGVGSNVEPERNVPRALAMLAERFGEVQRSRAYRNPAVGFSGEDFVNLVVRFRTEDPVTAVGMVLAEVEDACGRERGGEKFAPRTLDLDLLLYGDLVRGQAEGSGPGPVLPREEILDRAFVLGPLAELAPELVHPTEGRTMAELWETFPGERDGLEPVDF